VHATTVRFREPVVLALGETRIDLATKVLIMGIVNRTPDSFFDAGETFALDASLRRAERLIEEGADIIDIGGVKAGSGPPVSLEEELERVVPFVEALKANVDVPISVDTWNADVAEACYRAGALIGNDISGFADPRYLEVAARYRSSVVATHIRLAPRVDDPDPRYPNDDVVEAVNEFLIERLARAVSAGIERERVMFDAGLDLGKTTPQSLELLRQSDRLAALGQPVFLSASNKGFLGDLLGLAVGERRDATMGALALGIARGCRVLRVHDVKGARRIANTLEAILCA
jgi:dihydropteroate synthase